MSAKFYFRPITDGVWIEGATSSFKDEMVKVFGGFPVTLTRDDLLKLDVMRRLESGKAQQPYHMLYEAVYRFGSVEIYAEH